MRLTRPKKVNCFRNPLCVSLLILQSTGGKTKCLQTEFKKIVKNIRSRVSAGIKKAFLEVYSVESNDTQSSELWWTMVTREIKRVDVELSDKKTIELQP